MHAGNVLCVQSILGRLATQSSLGKVYTDRHTPKSPRPAKQCSVSQKDQHENPNQKLVCNRLCFSQNKLPVRWMALEAIETLLFTVETDV